MHDSQFIVDVLRFRHPVAALQQLSDLAAIFPWVGTATLIEGGKRGGGGGGIDHVSRRINRPFHGSRPIIWHFTFHEMSEIFGRIIYSLPLTAL